MKTIVLSCTFILLSLISIAQDKNVSGGSVFEGEPYMIVNPANPRHIVVAWMGYVALSRVHIKVKATFDGGTTWSAAAVIPHQSSSFTSADVSMAFDHSGNLYAAYIDSRQSPDSGGVFIVKSTDGGLSWGSTIHKVIDAYDDGSKRPLDRPWLVIGKGSSGATDTFYITTKPAPWVAAPNRPYFLKSTDYGVTWSAWKYIDTTGYRVGNLIQAPMAAPSVDSAGKFHCVYPAYYPAESIYPRYIMASGGTPGMFTYNVVYSSATTGGLDTLAKSGSRLICDPAANKHYAVFSLQNSTTDIDVSCFETNNGGATWAAPQKVNNDALGNGKMQDMVWANFDEHGNMIAAWRDRRNAPGSGYQQPSEIWGAVKWKDSATFSANFRISDTIVAYDSVYLSGNGNDFMNVVMAADTMSAVWGDVRTGALNIWFSRKGMRGGTTAVTQQIVKEQLPVVAIYPNPATNTITVEGNDITSLALYDLSGKNIVTQDVHQQHTTVDISKLIKGHYIITVVTKTGIVTERIAKE